MSRVVLNAAVSSATEFNNYAIIAIDDTLKAIHLGLVNKAEKNYEAVKLFKLFGHI